jgi:hypothetical protein
LINPSPLLTEYSSTRYGKQDSFFSTRDPAIYPIPPQLAGILCIIQAVSKEKLSPPFPKEHGL